MAPDAAAALVRAACAAVAAGALPYALALAWERDGAAAWTTCPDGALLVELAALVDRRAAAAAVVAVVGAVDPCGGLAARAAAAVAGADDGGGPAARAAVGSACYRASVVIVTAGDGVRVSALAALHHAAALPDEHPRSEVAWTARAAAVRAATVVVDPAAGARPTAAQRATLAGAVRARLLAPTLAQLVEVARVA